MIGKPEESLLVFISVIHLSIPGDGQLSLPHSTASSIYDGGIVEDEVDEFQRSWRSL
jgi:hypothetical protein